MAGYRKWQGSIAVGVSGPASSHVLRTDLKHPIDFYPKMMAQLRHTSADSKYLADWFDDDEVYGVAPSRSSIHLEEPDFSALKASFDDVGEWFEMEADADDGFDGGELIFTFSGHGREGDGTLFLHDKTYFSADDFVDACLEVQQRTNAPRGLRVALLLDSCYSGEFLLRTLHRILTDDELYPEYMLASSMPDEVSWEYSVLGHGLATYCFSVKPHYLGSIAATASSASGIPLTWSIAEGPDGCSYITSGIAKPHSLYGLQTPNCIH